MLPLSLNNCRSMLCIGAHPDDIEIGCAGTLARFIHQQPETQITWIVFSGDPIRQAEAKASASEWLSHCSSKRVEIYSFEDGYFPAQWSKLKDQLRSLATEVQPDIIFSHRLEDRHQDHRVLAELTWQTFRNHMIFEYEIPKFEGDLGQPNIFVELTPAQATQKSERILHHFQSQAEKLWLDNEMLEGHLRLRGIECQSRFAEAFYVRKARLDLL